MENNVEQVDESKKEAFIRVSGNLSVINNMQFKLARDILGVEDLRKNEVMEKYQEGYSVYFRVALKEVFYKEADFEKSLETDYDRIVKAIHDRMIELHDSNIKQAA